MIETKSGLFIFKRIEEGFKFEGCRYLDSQLTFISKGKYKITLVYQSDQGEKVLTLTGKGISRITLNVDRFFIQSLNSEDEVTLIINNIRDYFFDLLSDN